MERAQYMEKAQRMQKLTLRPGASTTTGTTTAGSSAAVLSRRFQCFTNSAVFESRRERMLRIPESALDSRRLRGVIYVVLEPGPVDASVVEVRHGKLRARSARVSRRLSCAFWRWLCVCCLAAPPPLHSRKISVSWASELRRRRWRPVSGQIMEERGRYELKFQFVMKVMCSVIAYLVAVMY